MTYINKKTGFSLVEVMIIFTIIAVLMAAAMPVITKRTIAPTKRVIHGAYICIANGVEGDGDNTFTQEWFNASGVIQDLSHDNAQSCTFEVPEDAENLHVYLYGAGSGGRRYADYTVTSPTRVEYTISGQGIIDYSADIIQNKGTRYETDTSGNFVYYDKDGRVVHNAIGNKKVVTDGSGALDLFDYMQLTSNDNSEVQRAKIPDIPSDREFYDLLNGLDIIRLNGVSAAGNGGTVRYYLKNSPIDATCIYENDKTETIKLPAYEGQNNVIIPADGNDQLIMSQLLVYCKYKNPTLQLDKVITSNAGNNYVEQKGGDGRWALRYHHMVKVLYDKYKNVDELKIPGDKYPFLTYLGRAMRNGTNYSINNGGCPPLDLTDENSKVDKEHCHAGYTNAYQFWPKIDKEDSKGNKWNEHERVRGEDVNTNASSQNQQDLFKDGDIYPKDKNFLYRPTVFTSLSSRDSYTNYLFKKGIAKKNENDKISIPIRETDGKYVQMFPSTSVPYIDGDNKAQVARIIPDITRQTSGKGGVLRLDRTIKGNITNYSAWLNKTIQNINGLDLTSLETFFQQDYAYHVLRGYDDTHSGETADNGNIPVFNDMIEGKRELNNNNLKNEHFANVPIDRKLLMPFRIIWANNNASQDPNISRTNYLGSTVTVNKETYEFVPLILRNAHYNLAAVFRSNLLKKQYKIGGRGNEGEKREATFNNLRPKTACTITLPKGGKVWDIADGKWENGKFENPAPNSLQDAVFECRNDNNEVIASLNAKSGAYEDSYNYPSYTYLDVTRYTEENDHYPIYSNLSNGVGLPRYWLQWGGIIRYQPIMNDIVDFIVRTSNKIKMADIWAIGRPGSATNLRVNCLAPSGTTERIAYHYMADGSTGNTRDSESRKPNSYAETRWISGTGKDSVPGPLRTFTKRFNGIQTNTFNNESMQCYQNDNKTPITIDNVNSLSEQERTYHIGMKNRDDEPFYIIHSQGIRYNTKVVNRQAQGKDMILHSDGSIEYDKHSADTTEFDGGGGAIIITW